jgi:hypothetical protein
MNNSQEYESSIVSSADSNANHQINQEDHIPVDDPKVYQRVVAEIETPNVQPLSKSSSKRQDSSFFQRDSPFPVPTSKPQSKTTFSHQLGGLGKKRILEPTNSSASDATQLGHHAEPMEATTTTTATTTTAAATADVNYTLFESGSTLSAKGNMQSQAAKGMLMPPGHRQDSSNNNIDAAFEDMPIFSKVRFNVVTPAEQAVESIQTKDKPQLEDYLKLNDEKLKCAKLAVQKLYSKISGLNHSLAEGVDRY